MSLHQHGCNQRLSFGVKRVRKRQISYGITYTWNLKHDTVKLSMKQKQTYRQREQTGGCQGGWVSRRMEWEAGVRCKLLYRDKINNKVLLHSSADFIFWGSKITADGDCSHEIKRRLLLGRKVIINLDSIFKSRDITFPAKVRLPIPLGNHQSALSMSLFLFHR